MSNSKGLSRRKIVGLGASGVLAAAVGTHFGYNIIHRPRNKNVIFIISDAMRADRLGCYGYRREGRTRAVSPNINALAARGVLFEKCFSSSSWTLPSAASYMTSRLPFVVGDAYNEGFVTPGCRTCAETMKAHGYATAAVVHNPYLYVRGSKANKNLTIGRGFDEYRQGAFFIEDNPAFADGIGLEKAFARFGGAESATKTAIELLERFKRERTPFFLYVHYMDTHEPYNPPAPYKAECGAPEVKGIPDHVLYQAIRTAGRARGDEALTETDMPLLARAEALYDASVTYVDTWIGRLVEHLDSTGLFDETLVVLAADHGEEFGEHGWIGHSRTLYEESIHVPLVAAGRGVDEGLRIDTPVRMLDVAPTILASCGLEAPPTMFGTPLALDRQSFMHPSPAISCLVRPDGPEPLVEKKYASRDPRGMKYIRSEFLGEKAELEPIEELFDLEADAAESVSIIENEPQAADALRSGIERAMASTASVEGEHFTVDEEVRAQLKAIGYFQ